jgi:hypothetical protein
VRDPEVKRHIIGEQFVKVQERIIEERGLLDGRWILGQGTIYPDTIESGGTARAATIKTHHNRVPGIQKLMDAGASWNRWPIFTRMKCAPSAASWASRRSCSTAIRSPVRASPSAASAPKPTSL